MSENSDHQRLGLEVFKVLENTSLEKQACMLAKAFKAFLSENVIKINMISMFILYVDSIIILLS